MCCIRCKVSGAAVPRGRQRPSFIFAGLRQIPAFGAAIDAVFALGKEGLHAVPAQMQGLGFVCQSKGEHHLNAQQQRMEIPYKNRMIMKLYMIGRRVAVE